MSSSRTSKLRGQNLGLRVKWGHIYQVTGRGPCWAGCPRTTPFLSVRGHCTACDGLDSKPARGKLQRSIGSGVLLQRPALRIRVSLGGSLQYRHHDKPLQTTHAGLTRHHSQADYGKAAHRSRLILGSSAGRYHEGTASRFLFPHCCTNQLTRNVSRASRTYMLPLLDPLRCFQMWARCIRPWLCALANLSWSCTTAPVARLSCVLWYPRPFCFCPCNSRVAATLRRLEDRCVPRSAFGVNGTLLTVNCTIWSHLERASNA